MKKIFITVLCCLSITACSSLDSIEYASESEQQAVWLGEATIKVPDYYSTRQVETNFKIGQKYSIQGLRCENEINKC